MATKPAKKPAPSDTLDKFMLRMPEGMRERIAKSAKENNRSMNAEIVSRLERSLSPTITFNVKDNYSYSEVETLFNSMNARMERLEDRILKLIDKR